MADAFAEPSDVEARWRTLTDAEQSIASTLLGDASDMIRERWPDAGDRLEASSLTRIVANMAKRALMNSAVEGVTQQSQAAGAFNLSQTFANPTGNLYLTAEDVRLLDGDTGSPKVRMGWLA